MPDPNQNEFNQLAKQALLSLGRKPDHSTLYCLQLARYALDCGLLEAPNPGLSQNLDEMFGWEPENAWNFLETGKGWEDLLTEDNLLAYLPENPSPTDIAWVVLDQLDSRLGATLEGYPRARDLPANFR